MKKFKIRVEYGLSACRYIGLIACLSVLLLSLCLLLYTCCPGCPLPPAPLRFATSLWKYLRERAAVDNLFHHCTAAPALGAEQDLDLQETPTFVLQPTGVAAARLSIFRAQILSPLIRELKPAVEWGQSQLAHGVVHAP